MTRKNVADADEHAKLIAMLGGPCMDLVRACGAGNVFLADLNKEGKRAHRRQLGMAGWGQVASFSCHRQLDRLSVDGARRSG